MIYFNWIIAALYQLSPEIFVTQHEMKWDEYENYIWSLHDRHKKRSFWRISIERHLTWKQIICDNRMNRSRFRCTNTNFAFERFKKKMHQKNKIKSKSIKSWNFLTCCGSNLIFVAIFLLMRFHRILMQFHCSNSFHCLNEIVINISMLRWEVCMCNMRTEFCANPAKREEKNETAREKSFVLLTNFLSANETREREEADADTTSEHKFPWIFHWVKNDISMHLQLPLSRSRIVAAAIIFNPLARTCLHQLVTLRN